jgi:hypothetical protein
LKWIEGRGESVVVDFAVINTKSGNKGVVEGEGRECEGQEVVV